jgi:TMEM175 potassium channel family protein
VSGEGREAGERKLPGARALTLAGFIEYDRVVFFSDAVFAIAITLLAVNLPVPAVKGHVSTGTELSNAVPGLFSFGISFAVIGLFWLGHHAIFRYIVALDRPLIGLNLLFLGTIAFLPYPTAVLGVASGPHPAAIVFYAACAGTSGLTEGAIWLYATFARDNLTDPSVQPFRLHYALRIARIPVVFYASIPLALVAPRVTAYFWILIWVLGVAINRLVPGREEPGRIG